MAANHHERKRYWQFWREYVEPFTGVNDMLTDVPDPGRIDLLLGFAYWAWQGDYGEGALSRSELAPFKSRFMPSATRHSNWCLLEGLPNSTYRPQ
jgi:hypothetical protein